MSEHWWNVGFVVIVAGTVGYMVWLVISLLRRKR